MRLYFLSDNRCCCEFKGDHQWEDSNNAGEGCTNRDKFIAFSVAWGGWSGWLGVTHRKLTSDWYNGQYYAGFLGIAGTGYT
jgi:hypothetical protein